MIKIQLHPDWKKIVQHAWSMRLMAIGFGFECLQASMEYLPDVLSDHPGVLTFLSVLCVVGGLVSRIIIQEKVSGS